jgi:hypothetical protein
VPFLSAAAAVCAPWVVFSTIYFGSPVPTSAIAKASLDVDPWTSAHNLADYFLGGHLGVTLAALPGAVLLWRTGSLPCRLWLVWGVLYAGAFTVMNGFTHFPWYFVPLLPLCFACAATAIVRGGAALLPRVRIALPPAFATIGLVLAVLLMGSARLGAHARYLSGLADGREHAYAAVARQLAERDPSCLVAATEIGALGYHYPGPMLDLIGLVSPQAIARDMGIVLRESRAKWLVTYDTHFPREIVESRWFEREFVRTSSIAVSNGRWLEVFERRTLGACP